MQDIVRNNYRCAVVFEDDILFEGNFKNVLEKTLDHAPHDVDVLFLDVGLCCANSDPYRADPGTLLECFELLPRDNRYVVKLNGKPSVFGAHAYVLTLNGARKILQNSRSLAWPIDNHIIMDKRLSKYVARKKMLYINDEVSEIHKMGRGFTSLKNSVIAGGKQK
jgi:GR25 family glycosyltransferase involved in LPS biosynthesis